MSSVEPEKKCVARKRKVFEGLGKKFLKYWGRKVFEGLGRKVFEGLGQKSFSYIQKNDTKYKVFQNLSIETHFP